MSERSQRSGNERRGKDDRRTAEVPNAVSEERRAGGDRRSGEDRRKTDEE